jgi:hypothetical protein
MNPRSGIRICRLTGHWIEETFLCKNICFACETDRFPWHSSSKTKRIWQQCSFYLSRSFLKMSVSHSPYSIPKCVWVSKKTCWELAEVSFLILAAVSTRLCWNSQLATDAGQSLRLIENVWKQKRCRNTFLYRVIFFAFWLLMLYFCYSKFLEFKLRELKSAAWYKIHFCICFVPAHPWSHFSFDQHSY